MCRKKYTAFIALFGILICCIIFAVNYKIVIINGQSMEPTLRSRQFVLAKRTEVDIKNGDIIVFSVSEKTYIKRVFASSGDTVELKDGLIYINGASVHPYKYDSAAEIVYALGDGEFFVMGDNAGSSMDSRVFGLILSEQIIGKVILH